jgi:hypothetical protein
MKMAFFTGSAPTDGNFTRHAAPDYPTFSFLIHRTSGEWVNPATIGLVVVHTSDGSSLPCGSVSDLLNRSSLPAYFRTSEARDSWFAVDLGLWVEPTHYSLRHGEEVEIFLKQSINQSINQANNQVIDQLIN